MATVQRPGSKLDKPPNREDTKSINVNNDNRHNSNEGKGVAKNRNKEIKSWEYKKAYSRTGREEIT